MARSNLYLVVFPEKRVVKIGKANDVLKRLECLRRWWGEPDHAASYRMEADEAAVFRIEKALHCLLDAHAVPFDDGDGRTELFAEEALGHALTHIETFLTLNPSAGLVLEKGIPVPVSLPPQAIRSKPQREHKRFVSSGTKMFDSIGDCLARLRDAHRLAAVLIRRQERMAFQWDEVDGRILLRVRNHVLARRDNASRILDRLHFHIEDLDGYRSISLCSLAGSGDLIQFSFGSELASAGADEPGFLGHMLRHARHWFEKIPRRSPAVAEDLPILDFRLA